MANLINQTAAGEIDPARAGKLGYLASILQRVIEHSDLEERIAKLEREYKKQGVTK